jgi:hypothetical protein
MQQQVEWASMVMLVAVVVMPVAGLIVAYLFRRMEHDERLRAIERGVSLAAEDAEVRLKTRRAGLTLIGAGLGTMAGCLVAATKLGSHMIAGIGLGFIPFGAGVALLLDYWLQGRGKAVAR